MISVKNSNRLVMLFSKQNKNFNSNDDQKEEKE